MVIQLDPDVLAYASASYAAEASAAASKDPGALRRMVTKIQDLVHQHGKSILRHTAVLALVTATVVAVDKALEYPRIARRLALTTGRLKSTAEIAALGFALYKMVSALLAAITPADDGYGTPSMHQRLLALDQKNEELRRTVDDVQSKLHDKVANQGRDLGVENVTDIDETRRRRRKEQEDEEGEEEENPDSAYDGPPLPGPLKHFQKKHQPEPAHAATEPQSYGTIAKMFEQLRKSVPQSAAQAKLVGGAARVWSMGDAVHMRLTDAAGRCIDGLPNMAFGVHSGALRMVWRNPLGDTKVVHEITSAVSVSDMLNQALAWYKNEVATYQQQLAAHREKRRLEHAHAGVEMVTALTILQERFPNTVTTHELYPNIQPEHTQEDIRFLRKIENLDAGRRDAYARRLAADPEKAQGFVDRVFAITRRLRRDSVGNKVHRLGTFVVKWATIFAVQAIMFKMLVYVTKSKAFNAIGGVTRFGLACLCALNSVLVLVHSAGPESEDTQTIHSIRKTAVRSKAVVHRLTAS